MVKAGRAGGLLGGRVIGRWAVGRWAVCGVLVALASSGCGGGRGASSAADQSFVAAVHLGAPDIASFRSDTQLIRLGHAACDAFKAGAGYQEIADRMGLLEGSHPLPSQDLGVVVTSAVDAYCPQFHSQV